MAKPVSMEDIARHLDISRATVSYVLNGRHSERISEGTKARVLEAAQSMGYRPNRAAQALAGRPSHLIRLCLNDFEAPFYGQLQGAFQRQFLPTSYQLHITPPRHSQMAEWESSNDGWPVDGLIVYNACYPSTIIPSLRARGVPIVTTGIYADNQTDCVFVDLVPAALEAVRRLAGRGKRIALVWGGLIRMQRRDPIAAMSPTAR